MLSSEGRQLLISLLQSVWLSTERNAEARPRRCENYC